MLFYYSKYFWLVLLFLVSQPIVRMSNENFDPIEFINTTYAESTYSELNDSLSSLSKSIARTKKERKALIAEHFSKFIECRTIMDGIWADARAKNLEKPLTERVEKQHSLLMQKYLEIFSNISADLNESVSETDKIYYINEYSAIFTLKDDLIQNIHTPETFVAIYSRAKRISADVSESVFIQNCFKDVQPLVREFLNQLFKLISDRSISFEDACYYFEMYFAIWEPNSGRETLSGVDENKTKRKIMNTLLVCFKESIADEIENGSKAIFYILHSLNRLLKHVDEEIGCSAVEYFFEAINKILNYKELRYVIKVLRKIIDFNIKLKENSQLKENEDAEIRRVFISNLSECKLRAFTNLIKNGNIEGFPEIYTEFESLVNEDEKNRMRNTIVDQVQEIVEKKKYKDYEYLHYEAKELSLISKILGVHGSVWNKRMRGFLRKHKESAITNIAKGLDETAKKGNRVLTLMESLRIMGATPQFCYKIIFEAKDAIMSDPVVFYYMAKTLKMDKPSLDGEYVNEVEKLKTQFGFLL